MENKIQLDFALKINVHGGVFIFLSLKISQFWIETYLGDPAEPDEIQFFDSICLVFLFQSL